ncbi:hypothetical protein MANES_13G067900v8 [Manihot esculenta]|uniref:Uncharacterized protein n=1 Tax=Manihot esculenta TaxID=3983 RepID=A0A2C9UPQ5_MANES|nr:hypothetical protein MANES_13G067900v8 [Manihot esculenta]
MNPRFGFSCFLVIALLTFLVLRSSQTTGMSFSSATFATRTHQQFRSRPPVNVPVKGRSHEFEFQKRRVPTGSNPLHNKKRL